jgi:hypothetical protein
MATDPPTDSERRPAARLEIREGCAGSRSTTAWIGTRTSHAGGRSEQGFLGQVAKIPGNSGLFEQFSIYWPTHAGGLDSVGVLAL